MKYEIGNCVRFKVGSVEKANLPVNINFTVGAEYLGVITGTVERSTGYSYEVEFSGHTMTIEPNWIVQAYVPLKGAAKGKTAAASPASKRAFLRRRTGAAQLDMLKSA